MTHVNVREVLESLSLAKEAYDAVPDLRRQIDDLQAAVASKDRLLSQTQSQLEETIHGKANVEAKLKEVESDRDDYFLRHEEAQEKLDRMAELIGVNPGKAVNPAEQSTPATESVTQGQSATDPIQTVNTVTETSSTTPESTGQSAIPPTQEALTTTGTTEPIGDTSPNQGFTETVARSAESPHWSGSTQHDSGDETHVVELKPYEGRPSWEKPHDMAWGDWEAKGGTIPQWMKSHG